MVVMLGGSHLHMLHQPADSLAAHHELTSFGTITAVNGTDTPVYSYPLHNFMYQWAQIKAAWTVHLANRSRHTHTNTLALPLLPILNRLGPWSTLNLFICQSVRVYASSLNPSSAHTHPSESISQKQSRRLYHILNEAGLLRYQIALHLRGAGRCSCVRGSNTT